MPNAITISIEGLGTSLVGAYGSNTAITPTLDAMAARGLLLDNCFLDSQCLELNLRSLATGRHCLQKDHPEVNLWSGLRDQGQLATFITDSQAAAEWAEANGCQRVLMIEPPPNMEAEEDPLECAVLALFATAAAELSDIPGGFVWLHSSGLRLAWDAPLELRRQFTDPEDPPPPQTAQPPQFEIHADTDPDLVTGWAQVAAAQVAMIDEGIATIEATIGQRHDATQWAWSIIGLGGVPLGEHGRVGWGRPQLHSEELQCVAIHRPIPHPDIGWRRGELCQLPDVGATMMESAGLDVRDIACWGRSLLSWAASDTPARWPPAHQLAALRTDLEIWVRTPAWSGILPNEFEDEARRLSARLYVKPDDRWETCEVANRCPAIIEKLYEHATAFVKAAANGHRQDLPQLDDDLCEFLR